MANIIHVRYNEERKFLLDVTSGAIGVEGLSIKLKIQQLSDGYWWDGDSWEAAATVLDMVERDSTDQAGLYEYDFTPATDSDSYILHAYAYNDDSTPQILFDYYEIWETTPQHADVLRLDNYGIRMTDLGEGFWVPDVNILGVDGQIPKEEGILAIAYIDGIYLNYGYGFDEEVPPYGTNRLPVLTLAEALTLCSSQKQHEIKVLFSWEEVTVSEEGMGTIKLTGLRPVSYDGGFDFQTTQAACHFENLRIRNNSGYMDRCTFLRCLVSGTISLSKCILDESSVAAEGEIRPTGGQTEIIRKATFIDGASFNFMNAITGIVYLFGCQGILSIANLITAETINIVGFKGKITIEESCIAGTINIYGLTGELIIHPGLETSSTVNRYENPIEEIMTGSSLVKNLKELMKTLWRSKKGRIKA